MSSSDPPVGTVSFVFTDIEGSTHRWEHHPDAMRKALPRHEVLLRAAIETYDGYVFKTVGDAFCAAFDDPRQAVHAAVEVQRTIAAEDWSSFGAGFEPLHVRVGIHTGTAEMRHGDYFGPSLNRVARLEAAGHGGQVLLSLVTRQLVRGQLPDGATLVDLGEHRLKDLVHAEHVFQLLAPGFPEVRKPLRTAETLSPHDRIVADEAADRRSLAEAEQLLLDAVLDESRTAVFRPEQLRDVAGTRPRNLTEYRLGRIAEWSQPRYHLDGRFVKMALLIDQGEEALGGRWDPHAERFDDLVELLSSATDPAFVVLGPPGSGKSTLLRHFELVTAINALRVGAGLVAEPEAAPGGSTAVDGPRTASDGAADLLTFFVPLSQFKPSRRGDPLPAPGDWLADRWRRRYPDLPDLATWLERGTVTLLLDGLNEVPVASESDFYDVVRSWKDFVQQLHDRAPGSRVVFSCRSLDYSAPLSTPALPVPQITIDPLSDEQVRQFLHVYTPLYQREIWSRLEGAPQLDMLRSPYFLRLLVQQVEAEGEIPDGRAGLFAGFFRQALRREIERDNPLFRPGHLLAGRDLRRVVKWRWRTPWDLPDRGLLVPKLSDLAYEMQCQRFDGEAAQVRVDYDDALDILDCEHDEDILRAGQAVSMLDEDTVSEEVRFVHQLVQEFMAGRRLAEAPDAAPELARVPWREDEVVPDLEAVKRMIAPADPLPPSPTTGWEETALLAAAMTADPDAFVRRLVPANLALAGRCMTQTEVRLSDGVRDEVVRALVDRTCHRNADLRARIEAALVLGRIGDPRFEPRQGPRGAYLRPPMVDLPAGTYVVGRDDAPDEDESPAHTVTLEAFALGRFPVTNAEWSRFVASGGYEDEEWWVGDAALAWQRGEGTSEGQRNSARLWTAVFRAHPDRLASAHDSGRLDDEAHALWLERTNMDDEALEAHLREAFPGGRLTEPRFWHDRHYRHPLQPVVGVSWFEACAYCRWLTAQSGQAYRLPTEAEWEAAARGAEGRDYAYGVTFDAARCNTAETHLRRPAPVGVFPSGDTPEGLSDMTGNTWDWTSSLYGVRQDRADFGYPYRADDGRENHLAGADVTRVARGGSWFWAAEYARATTRYVLYPDGRNFNLGFRLARSVAA